VHDRFGGQGGHRQASLPSRDGGTIDVTVSGVAKGVGMIHPQMATMLSRAPDRRGRGTRDALGPAPPAAARTWDQLSVDGDTSTNDTVFVLASGRPAPHRWSPARRPRPPRAAIEAVARDLAGSRPPTARGFDADHDRRHGRSR
jgi:N-acetylglutamate synthase/N-acetylornithine aminotransferase